MSWYAIKTRPGTQRPATPRIGEPEERKGEFIIERNVRDADIEIFMPSFRKDIKHHRTKELIERRFAMIVGYSFVYLPSRNFYRLSRVDGVTAILGVDGCPARISDFEVASIRQAEEMAGSSLQRERDARRKRSRKQLLEEFPKDKAIRIAPEHRMVGGMLATVLDVTGRNTVKAVVQYLGGLVHVDLSLDMIDKVA